MGRTWVFGINRPPEDGTLGYTDRVTLSLDSGDPGGEEGEFEMLIAAVLETWFDGAKIVTEVDDA